MQIEFISVGCPMGTAVFIVTDHIPFWPASGMDLAIVNSMGTLEPCGGETAPPMAYPDFPSLSMAVPLKVRLGDADVLMTAPDGNVTVR